MKLPALATMPIVATVTMTPIGPDMKPAEPPTTIALDHETNAEVCDAVRRMIERQSILSMAGVAS